MLVYTSAVELSSPKCQTWMKRSYHHPFIDRNRKEDGNNDESPEKVGGACEERWAKNEERANEEPDKESVKSVTSAVSQTETTVLSGADVLYLVLTRTKPKHVVPTFIVNGVLCYKT